MKNLYFISYLKKVQGVDVWHPKQVLTRQFPVSWLVDMDEDDDYSYYKLVSWQLVDPDDLPFDFDFDEFNDV